MSVIGCDVTSKTDILKKPEFFLKFINWQGSEFCSQKYVKKKTTENRTCMIQKKIFLMS